MTKSEGLWKIISNSIPQAIAITDHHLNILDFNSAWTTIAAKCSPVSPPDWRGLNFKDGMELFSVCVGPTNETLLSCMNSVLEDALSYVSLEYHTHTGTGTQHHLFLELTSWRADPSDVINGLILTLHDLSMTGAEPNCAPQSHSIRSQLVPMCAVCKRIRDAHEEWNSIESYLKKCYRIEFTHDICPDCIRRVYPKYSSILDSHLGE